MSKTVKNYINGAWVESKSSRKQPVLNPATGETLAEVPLSTAAEVDKAAKKSTTSGYRAPGGRSR